MRAWLRPFRLLPGCRPPLSTIQPMDKREERDLAELRSRRASATPKPAFDHGKVRERLEAGLLMFHESPPEDDVGRAMMVTMGEAYSAGLTGPAQDDRIALVLWWCALIVAERGK